MTKQYKKPEDMIDYNEELDTINGLMSIFYAYNQQNQDEKKRWSVWPEWELCLTSMNAGNLVRHIILFHKDLDYNDI